MSTNKKPRKKYVRKPCGVPIMPVKDIEFIRGLFCDASIMCHVSLNTGLMTYKDAAILRDAINFAKVIFVMEEKNLDPEYKETASKILGEGGAAFGSWYRRGVQRGGLDDPKVRFVATGDEINAIRAAFDYVHELIQYKIDESPVTVLKWFTAMQRMLRGAGCGRVEISVDGIHAAMNNRYAKMNAIDHYLGASA